jgi:uncharacterized protein DUF1592/uncharacterized protein DUF1588/uncharacterized protein DUF1595
MGTRQPKLTGARLGARWPNAAIFAAMGMALEAGCTGHIGDSAVAGVGASSGLAAGQSTGSASGTSMAGATAGGGSSSGAGAVTPDATPTSFACNPTQKSAVDQLRILTTTQYQNTLSDLASWALGNPTGGATVMTEIASAMSSLQPNLPVVPQANPLMAATFPDGGYLRADQDQQYTRIQAFYAIGNAMGAALTSVSRLGTVVGACATDADATNDAACLTSFIQSFGARALRRPVTASDVTFYESVYGSDTTADPAAYADVIAVMLNAPEFLYFVEHGDQPVANVEGVYTLGAFELASRLSYHVWDTMPDDELWSAAQDGSLLQDAVYQKEVDRLFADPRAQATLHRFFSDYLQTNSSGGPMGLGGLNYRNPAAYDNDPIYKALAGTDLPSATLGQSMVDDALGMLDYYTWATAGTLHDLLTSGLSFAKSADLAKIYGLTPWDGMSAPPSFADGQRPGLFTRALFLAGGSDTNPILKGVFLRRYVLCDAVGKPPPAAANATIVLSANETTREVVTALTKNVPCNSCHTTWINPLGFATENFDGLGRLRTEETLFNSDGTVAGMLPVDTTSVPRVEMNDTTTSVQGMADLMNVVERSGKAEACLARNYFRYSFARFEDTTLDACALESMRQTIDPSAGPGHLADLFKQVVLTAAFKQRTFD